MSIPTQSSWGYFMTSDGPPAEAGDVVVVEEGVHVGVVVGGSVGGFFIVLLAVVLAVKRGLEMVELITRHLSALFAACTRARENEDVNQAPTPPPLLIASPPVVNMYKRV